MCLSDVIFNTIKITFSLRVFTPANIWFPWTQRMNLETTCSTAGAHAWPPALVLCYRSKDGSSVRVWDEAPSGWSSPPLGLLLPAGCRHIAGQPRSERQGVILFGVPLCSEKNLSESFLQMDSDSLVGCVGASVPDRHWSRSCSVWSPLSGLAIFGPSQHSGLPSSSPLHWCVGDCVCFCVVSTEMKPKIYLNGNKWLVIWLYCDFCADSWRVIRLKLCVPYIYI